MPRRLRLFEQLEPRTLLSAAGLDTIVARAAVSTFSGPYQPNQISAAYGFNSIVVNGIVGNGSGQTIAIVDAYNDPNVTNDLAMFDTQFGLPQMTSTTFKVVSQTGTARYPATNSGWAMEISLDVEWAHAEAPGANILLVEASSASLTNLLAAVKYAADYPGVSVVSMSWGAGEFSGETGYDSTFVTPGGHNGVTFVAASGDSGAPAGWPVVSPNVLAAGGTALVTTVNSSSNYVSTVSETGWSDSGGGISAFEKEPSYQLGAQSTGRRTTPDVALDAAPNTGYLVYDSVPYYGQRGWWLVGGTSAAAPQWAALVAIANQELAASPAQLGSLTQTQTMTDLYAIYANKSEYTAAFNDITSGNNGYAAGPGYDMVTGLGSPKANALVNDLVAMTVAAEAPQTATTGSVVGPPAKPAGIFGHGGPRDLVLAAINGFVAAGNTADFAAQPAEVSLAQSATSNVVGSPAPAIAAPAAQPTPLVSLAADSYTRGSLPGAAETLDVAWSVAAASAGQIDLAGSGPESPQRGAAAGQAAAIDLLLRLPATGPGDGAEAAWSQSGPSGAAAGIAVAGSEGKSAPRVADHADAAGLASYAWKAAVVLAAFYAPKGMREDEPPMRETRPVRRTR
jgi:hypothetical protein